MSVALNNYKKTIFFTEKEQGLSRQIPEKPPISDSGYAD
jgi:hypothetical protein